MLGDMRFVDHTSPVDLTTWLGGTKRKSLRRLTQTLVNVFTADPPKLSFPQEWGRDDDGRGGKPPDDPATLYVDLPLGATEDDHCSWACSLEEAVDSVIELHERLESGKIFDEEGHAIALAIAKRLHELAKKLEDACAYEEGHKPEVA